LPADFDSQAARFWGPSSSALFAALEGRSLAPNLVLTATVEPDGSLGPIADLDVKIAGAGSYTVLYPFSQISNVPNHLTSGPTSRPVRTLQEARLLMLP
jgi:hypothetical protein